MRRALTAPNLYPPIDGSSPATLPRLHDAARSALRARAGDQRAERARAAAHSALHPPDVAALRPLRRRGADRPALERRGTTVPTCATGVRPLAVVAYPAADLAARASPGRRTRP